MATVSSAAQHRVGGNGSGGPSAVAVPNISFRAGIARVAAHRNDDHATTAGGDGGARDNKGLVDWVLELRLGLAGERRFVHLDVGAAAAGRRQGGGGE